MVDYQTWASIAIILQAIFTGALVYLTYQYSQATKQYAVATDKYVATSNSLLDEQRKTRKIQELHKKLECFYIPLWQHISLHKHPDSGNSLEYYKKFNNDTVFKDFMKYMYLCENEKIRSDLETLFDERERSGLQDRLINHLERVKDDIKELVQELKKLQSV